MQKFKTYLIAVVAFLLAMPIGAATKTQKVITGAEQTKAYLKQLKGKRVALFSNQTGVVGNKHLLDVLLENKVNVVTIFSPEHGFRGKADAGEKVSSSIDEQTGVPIYSLYGVKGGAPDDAEMQKFDVLLSDIQDVGLRFYTYYITMQRLMDRCAEFGKKMIVLDRPNPLGGEKVEGCLTEDDCVSFVSQFKIPYVYGLTCGELALLLNGERMLDSKPCQLTIIRMKGWKRSMTYQETGLQWIPSSPHIPQPISAACYAASGILGEFSYMNIGVGYTIPFQMFAAPWIEADKLAERLNALHLPGIHFRPIYAKPFYATMKNEQIQGVQVHFLDFHQAPLTDIQFLVAQEAAALYPDHKVFDVADKSRFRMFDLVCGTKQIRQLFSRSHRWDDAKGYWHKDEKAFKQLSKKYHLYK